ncbi:glycosyltransferase family 2 protein [Candidatus Latescibacterota bacterium]
MNEPSSNNTNPKQALITVYLITLNEEENILRALRSVSWADEIIVLDSGSTDRTCEIARGLGAKIYVEPFRGFVEQKNRALELCAGDWAFNLDADEEVTDSLRASIETAVRDDPDGSVQSAYEVIRRTWYLDRWILHCGWYPQYRCRLSQRGMARWTGDTLHESLTVSGQVGRLFGNLLHRPYRDLGAHLRAIDRYSDLFATREKGKGRSATIIEVILRPPLKFLKMYVLRGGFLDRAPGLIASLMGAWYTFMKYARLYERARIPR